MTAPKTAPGSRKGPDGYLLPPQTDDLGARLNGRRVHLDGNVARRKFKASGITWDDQLAGFGLRHSALAPATWIVQYRSRGATRRSVLGQVGKLSARAARSAAKAILAEAALDGLPLAPVRKHKAAGLTFRDYAEIFWKHYAPRWKPLTQRGNRSYIDFEAASGVRSYPHIATRYQIGYRGILWLTYLKTRTR